MFRAWLPDMGRTGFHFGGHPLTEHTRKHYTGFADLPFGRKRGGEGT